MNSLSALTNSEIALPSMTQVSRYLSAKLPTRGALTLVKMEALVDDVISLINGALALASTEDER
jgi:hypothetical protein